jgi:adenine-specific DNA-methyltransferase
MRSTGKKLSKAKTIWDENTMITEQGTIETKKLGLDGLFDFPKPVELIKRCVQLGTDKNDIILDFFAGSSTTAHSVIQQNKDDSGSRSFICVQLPFNIPEEHKAFKEGYRKISEISFKRIKLSLKELKDLSGVKYLRLSKSSFKKWQDFKGTDITDLESTLDLFNQSPLRDDWNKNKLLMETMLLEGFPLDSVLQKSTVGKNKVYQVQTDELEHQLHICMDEKIDDQTIAMLQLNSHVTFICLDSAISNVNKLRLSDKGLIKTI